MRISDWSSDVCSSDLIRGRPRTFRQQFQATSPHFRIVLIRQQLQAVVQRTNGAQQIMAQPGTKQGGEVDTLYSHSSSILCRNLHVFSPEPLMKNPDSLCKLDISANLHRLSSKPAMQRPLCDRPPQTSLRTGNDQP